MFVIVTHCAFLALSPPPISVLTLLMLHNEIHPSQLGGVAVCCGVVGIRDWECVCVYVPMHMHAWAVFVFKTGGLYMWHTTVLQCVENWFQSGQKPHAARSLSTRVSIYTHTQINHPHTCCRRVFLFWEEEGLMTYILQSETSFQPPPT